MHIAIDISPLQNEHKKRGIGVYAESLIKSLEKYIPDNSYTLVTRTDKIPKNADLIHYPYFDPFFLTLPIRKPKPAIVTVHDLIPIMYPDHFPRGLRGELKWRIQKFSLTQTRAIITDSNASKEAIAKIIDYPAEKIFTVYLAPKELFTMSVKSSDEERLRRQVHLPGHYILYVGDVNWNKNIGGLVEAFSAVQKKKPDLYLVLVGKSFLDNTLSETKAINAQIRNQGLENRIIRPGYVDDEILRIYYSMAAAYVQPSFAEGFGLPVLEAMACGAPCVVADNTSLSEIAGPSVRVKAGDTASISEGIWTVLNSDRNRMSKTGKDWVSKFTWKNAAVGTSQVYEAVYRKLSDTV